MAVSALTLMTRLNMQLSGLITALDVDIIGRETGKTLTRIKQTSADARLDVRDWEMAETRADMLRNAADALRRLESLRGDVLRVSEHGIFSPLDVVDISAQIDGICAELT